MKFRLFLSCVAGLLGSLAISAQANTQLAHVTNNVVDSGLCTIANVSAGNGWSAFQLTCGADVVYVSHSMGNGSSCSTYVSSGYSISGGCSSPSYNSYTLFKNPPPKKEVWIWLTDVTNTMTATPGSGCSVQSAGGTGGPGVTYVGYRVVCGSTVLPVTLTYNYQQGYCSVNTAPPGYLYAGGCNSYSVYRVEYQ